MRLDFEDENKASSSLQVKASTEIQNYEISKFSSRISRFKRLEDEEKRIPKFDSKKELAEALHRKTHMTAKNLNLITGIPFRIASEIQKSCNLCMSTEVIAPNRHLKQTKSFIRVPEQPMEQCAYDVAYMKTRNYPYMLVAIDLFSNYIYLDKLQDQNSVEIFNGLLRIFRVHSAPKYIRSDNHAANVSKYMYQKF